MLCQELDLLQHFETVAPEDAAIMVEMLERARYLTSWLAYDQILMRYRVESWV